MSAPSEYLLAETGNLLKVREPQGGMVWGDEYDHQGGHVGRRFLGFAGEPGSRADTQRRLHLLGLGRPVGEVEEELDRKRFAESKR